jgi:hypothetical protein
VPINGAPCAAPGLGVARGSWGTPDPLIHPPSGGSISGAPVVVVGSSANCQGHLEGDWGVSPVPQPPREVGGTCRHHQESPQEPIPGKQLQPVETPSIGRFPTPEPHSLIGEISCAVRRIVRWYLSIETAIMVHGEPTTGH